MGKFGGYGGGGNMQALMKQAQKLQQDMQKAQEKLHESVVTATVGGGLVNLEMNGAKELLSISIKPDMVDVDDIEMLEDMIVAAYNDAIKQIEALSDELMGPYASLGGGLF